MRTTMLYSITALLLYYPTLHARPVSPQELQVFSAQSFRVDYQKANETDKQKITDLYTKRVQTASVIAEKLKADPEYNYAVDSIALEIWTKRTAAKINPTDEELKKIFEQSKDLKVPAKYKLRKFTVADEAKADEVIEKLTKASDVQERTGLFSNYLAEHGSQKGKNTEGVWVAANTLAPQVRDVFKEKEAGSVVKFPLSKDRWEIIMIDEVHSSHPASFEEAKPFLVKMVKKRGVEVEMKRLLEAPLTAPKPAAVKPKAPIKPVK